MIEGKKKPDLAILIGSSAKGPPDKSGEDKEDSADESGEYAGLAREVLDAVKADDEKQVGSALLAFFEECLKHQ